MEQGSASQPPQETPQHSPGPWTKLLDASRQVLALWDSAEPFDPDDSPAVSRVEALAAATAAVDHIESAKADTSPALLKALKATVKWFAPDDETRLTLAEVQAAIAAAEGRDAE